MTKEWFIAFNNKCAKFTGWDYNFGSSLYYPSYEFAKAVGIGQGAWTLNVLRFHSDWNWIMEVVEAIQKIRPLIISHNHCEIHMYEERKNISINIAKNSTITAVIQSIDQFIDWYNKQKES